MKLHWQRSALMSASMIAAFTLTLATFMGLTGVSAQAADGFNMTTYHDVCNEQKRLYASCHNQREILDAGLAAAKERKELAVVILGFNDCPPCYVLDKWMKTDEAKEIFAPYTVVKLSIFDSDRKMRSEIFEDIIPAYELPINTRPPFGVPYFFIFDPVSKEIKGEGIAGFDSRDQSVHTSYLKAHSGQN